MLKESKEYLEAVDRAKTARPGFKQIRMVECRQAATRALEAELEPTREQAEEWLNGTR